jgi:S1-C subfamily serine protease
MIMLNGQSMKTSIVGLFMGVVILFVSGCEATGGMDDEELAQHLFSYEVYDESGTVLKEVTHERIGDTEVEISFGLFGEQFMPPGLVESIAEKTGRDPEEYNMHEIWLHAETDDGEEGHFVTLRFNFPFTDRWEAGGFTVFEVSEEKWVERLRSMWERFEDFRNKAHAKPNLLPNTIRFEPGPGEQKQKAGMQYYDSPFVTERSYGMPIDRTSNMYQVTGGSVELETVSDDRVEGSFSADVIALPMEVIFFADEFPDDPERAGVGSGFIIDSEGHIITNYHVVQGSDQISVMFYDGQEVEASLLGGDRFADVAVLKVDAEVPGLLELGDSDSLRPGEQVIAIGSALGDYTNTVTEGIVSALGRNLQISPGFRMENMLQHSASINPGNSGGPLLNLDGEVVGVNTAVVRSAGLGMTVEGMGFAIPSNTANELAQQLIDDGGLERPYVGIIYEPLTIADLRTDEAADWPIEDGVIVRQVEPDTPAANAGMEEGDIIVSINGQQIDNENPLINELFKYQVGDTIEIEVYRPSVGETLLLELTLAARPN